MRHTRNTVIVAAVAGACLTLGGCVASSSPRLSVSTTTQRRVTTDRSTSYAETNDDRRITPARMLAKGPIEGRRTLGTPIPLDSRNILMIPFAIEDKKGAFDDKDPYNTGGGRESGMKLSTGTFMERPKLPQPRGGEVRWHNVFFHDLDTGEDWALLDSRAVVSHYQTFWKREGDGWEQTTDLIVFAVTTIDSDGDNVLNDDDARMLYVCDGDGRNARRISPENAQIIGFRLDPDARRLWLSAIVDSNADGEFEPIDDRIPYYCDLDTGEMAKPIVSDDTLLRSDELMGRLSVLNSDE
ncbi:MAG: hypothetical protein KDA31_00070 [Phycisphaerales bacterium]|nr:hypothetical protein [Phycisphaerales bacterium]MCB9837320.1 hypothetical protein [Phycisphaera sp.]